MSNPRRPPWLKVGLGNSQAGEIRRLLKEASLNTVCQEARCPNRGECWSRGTATFLILGDHCTRSCAFCAVCTNAAPPQPDPEEPLRVARAVTEMDIRFAVITSVTRDDLADGGASHFAKTIECIRQESPEIHTEVLTPDFMGNEDAIRNVVASAPTVLGHNLETVRSLSTKVRDPNASYERSLSVLGQFRTLAPEGIVKSSLLLGLGEEIAEVEQTLADLRQVGANAVTMGQYLQPSRKHLPVARYLHPDEFKALGRKAKKLGFEYITATPLARSSYHAEKVLEQEGEGLF